MRITSFLAIAALALGSGTDVALAATYYVAPGGSDAAAGTIEAPFATLGRAQEVVEPGDTVFLRGGTYRMSESQIARKERIWAHVVELDKSGAEGMRIEYRAYEGETPVFDFSDVTPANYRVHAFSISGSWLHLKGIEIVGVQVTREGHTQSIGVANDGSDNVFERISVHDGQAIGIYSVRGSNNLFLNCDAYRNHDPVSEDGRGGNVDGFGCHPPKGATGNVFRGCRAWFNSDDGFDCINAHEAVTFENCWAFWNGYSAEFRPLADGNGFKAGATRRSPRGGCRARSRATSSARASQSITRTAASTRTTTSAAATGFSARPTATERTSISSRGFPTTRPTFRVTGISCATTSATAAVA